MTRRSVPPIVLVPLLIVAIVISSSACGTMANFNGGVALIGLPDQNRPPLPYGGVAWNVERAVKCDEPLATRVLIFPLWLLDVGLSAGLDTLTLPFVAWFHAKRIYNRELGVEAVPEGVLTEIPHSSGVEQPRFNLAAPTSAERALTPKN